MEPSIDWQSVTATVAEPVSVQMPEPESVPRRWFGRGRNRVRVPDWSPGALSQAKAVRSAKREWMAPAQSLSFDGRVLPPGRDEQSDTSEPPADTQTSTVAPQEVPRGDLRLTVESSASPLGRQTLQWQDSNEEGEPFGVRETALDARGRLRIRMNGVVYLVPIAADRGCQPVSVTPIGLHLLVADRDSGELLYELQHDPVGS